MAPRSKGPVVDTQMPSLGPRKPSLSPSGKTMGHNHAPFDLGQSMGNGGIPTVFFDDTLPAKVSRTTVSGTGVPASNLLSPPENNPDRGREKAKVPTNNK